MADGNEQTTATHVVGEVLGRRANRVRVFVAAQFLLTTRTAPCRPQPCVP